MWVLACVSQGTLDDQVSDCRLFLCLCRFHDRWLPRACGVPATTNRFEETLFQATADGTPFVDVLKEQGIVAGIKVDTGLTALPRTKNETATTGLDGLPERCARYYAQGARFAKWRAVMRIGKEDGAPSDAAILENTHALARYAQISQAAGLVPIVEPEILMDGDHDIETTAYYTERVLSFTFRALNEFDVCLDAALLKPNMVRLTFLCATRR